MTENSYRIRPFPLIRRISIDRTRLSRRKNYIKALIEIDITRVYQMIREKRSQQGQKTSVTAWVIQNIASTIAEYPEVQALRKRNKLIIITGFLISL